MVVVLAVLVSMVFAQAPKMARRGAGGMPGCMCMGWGQEISQQLNLTPQQIQQLKALHQNFTNATKDTRDQIKVLIGELATLWADENSTPDQIRAKVDQIDVLKNQMRNAAIGAMIQARTILTPDQRAKIRDMIKKSPHLGMGWMCPMASCMEDGKRPGMAPGPK
jgi:Spy/CpxP family protein refolding chaperone